MKLRPWQLSLIVLSLCALALATTFHYRATTYSGHDWLFRRLPTDHAVLIGIDVQALRTAGMLDLLSGTKAEEELDYRQFVDQTGFDYRTDLDYVTASISTNSDTKHFLLKGRFDWDALFQTAKRAGGRCLNGFCDLPGFAVGRNLSFLSTAPDVLGLSVSRTSQAAWSLSRDSTDVQMPRVPEYPVFLAMDAGVLSRNDAIPASLQGLTDILGSADYIVLGVNASNVGHLEFALDADCMSETTANALKGRIEQASLGSKGLGILHEVHVRSDGRSVHARWPIDRGALESLVSP